MGCLTGAQLDAMLLLRASCPQEQGLTPTGVLGDPLE